MNFEVLNKVPLLQSQLDRRIAYYANTLYSVESGKFNEIDNNKKRIIIVAKSNYSERWQSFSAINKAELNKLLALKKQSVDSHATIYQLIENKSIDGFDVKIIEFSQEMITKLGLANVYIPETELFHQQLDEILELDTPTGMLFCSVAGNKVNSAYAKGIVANIETYRLSAGLPSDRGVTKVSKVAYPQFLLTSLNKLSLNQLAQKALIKPSEWVNPNKLHWLYGAPLLTALAFYVLTNGYLTYSIYNLESSIGTNSQQVSGVLAQKKEIDINTAMINQLSSELASQNLTHNYWNIIYQAIEQGATLTRITYKKGMLTIRGKSEKASVLLTKISDYQEVETASFKGAVRKSGNQESFVINIVPKESV